MIRTSAPRSISQSRRRGGCNGRLRCGSRHGNSQAATESMPSALPAERWWSTSGKSSSPLSDYRHVTGSKDGLRRPPPFTLVARQHFLPYFFLPLPSQKEDFGTGVGQHGQSDADAVMHCKAVGGRAHSELWPHSPLGHRREEGSDVSIISHTQYHDIRPFPLQEICKYFFVFLLPLLKREVRGVLEPHGRNRSAGEESLLYELRIAVVLLRGHMALVHKEQPYMLPVYFLAFPQCLVDRPGRGAAGEAKNTVASFKYCCIHESFEESDACGGKLPVGIGGKVCEVHG